MFETKKNSDLKKVINNPPVQKHEQIPMFQSFLHTLTIILL